jgi:hypothetical protein
VMCSQSIRWYTKAFVSSTASAGGGGHLMGRETDRVTAANVIRAGSSIAGCSDCSPCPRHLDKEEKCSG